jgi:hypothetical protein
MKQKATHIERHTLLPMPSSTAKSTTPLFFTTHSNPIRGVARNSFNISTGVPAAFGMTAGAGQELQCGDWWRSICRRPSRRRTAQQLVRARATAIAENRVGSRRRCSSSLRHNSSRGKELFDKEYTLISRRY